MMANPGKQLTDQRWLDFWTWFEGEQQQIEGVLALGRAIRKADPGLLVEGAPWAQQFSEKPQAANWEAIRNMAAKAGAKHPDLVAAQWALESGWGKTLSGRNNPFGLKGAGTVKTTNEVINGKDVAIQAEFKDFPSLTAAVEHLVSRWYKDFEQNKGVNRGTTRNDAARLLVKEGYATDPKYAEKLIRLMDQHAPTTAPAQPTTFELDPRTPAEDGLAGPGKKAPMKPGDTYLLVNDRTQQMRAYSHTGALLWTLACLARGQGRDKEWNKPHTDTPPGLYQIGKVYRDWEESNNPLQSDTAESYGWYSFDMVDLEGQESRNGRSGIMLHGGGTACGWPGAWAPKQSLHPTLGCLRMHNIDLRDRVLPLIAKGIVYIGVFQER